MGKQRPKTQKLQCRGFKTKNCAETNPLGVAVSWREVSLDLTFGMRKKLAVGETMKISERYDVLILTHNPKGCSQFFRSTETTHRLDGHVSLDVLCGCCNWKWLLKRSVFGRIWCFLK